MGGGESIPQGWGGWIWMWMWVFPTGASPQLLEELPAMEQCYFSAARCCFAQLHAVSTRARRWFIPQVVLRDLEVQRRGNGAKVLMQVCFMSFHKK